MNLLSVGSMTTFNELTFIYFVCVVFSCHGLDVKIAKNHLYMALLGDFGISSKVSSIKKDVVSSLEKLHLQHPFDVAVETGDNVYEFGSDDTNYGILDTVFENDFPKQKFDFPFLIVLGNHDYYGDIRTQIRYGQENKRWYLPNRYYSVMYTLGDGVKVGIIGADSTPLCEIEMKMALGIDDVVQVENLEKMLEALNDSDYLFMLTHHPPISSFGPHSYPSSTNPLKTLCEKYRMNLVISGHNHNLQYFASPSGFCNQVVSGSTSKIKKVNTSVNQNDFLYYKTGGFVTLNISKISAELKFYGEDASFLTSRTINSRN